MSGDERGIVGEAGVGDEGDSTAAGRNRAVGQCGGMRWDDLCDFAISPSGGLQFCNDWCRFGGDY
jgi:hypothetical protein